MCIVNLVIVTNKFVVAKIVYKEEPVNLSRTQHSIPVYIDFGPKELI